MLRTVNVREETTSTLAKIRCVATARAAAVELIRLHLSDFGYASEIIHEFLDTFHAQIKQDPFSVLLLRATFLKVVSVIDLPLLRIQESESSDLESVAQFVFPAKILTKLFLIHARRVARYYSSHIVAFIRLCLEVVPVNMFRILTDHVMILFFCTISLRLHQHSQESYECVI
jgi:hypothetical protein